MTSYRMMDRTVRGRTSGWRLLTLGASLGALTACDGLLEADLPHLLTDAALEGPGTATTQVNSAIALFECGLSTFGWMALGHEDVYESIAGIAGTAHVYRTTPVTGVCDTSAENLSWFDQIMGARALLSKADGRGVYDRMQGEWDLGVSGERLSAISSIYMAASLAHFGEFMCEGALDGGAMMNPDDFLNLAETWINRAINDHLPAVGPDFAITPGISTSAMTMAIALRARIRWAKGDLANAAADAANVPDNFQALITRDAGPTRRNKYNVAGGFSGMLGVNTWWDGTTRSANPATGQLWPATVPFTGYLFLGIMPDGRALEAGNVPVRWAEEFRALGAAPTLLGNGSTPDTIRVRHGKQAIQGPQPREVVRKYWSSTAGDEDADIPLVTWREMRLIQAEYQRTQGNLQNAIDLVNDLRTAANLPLIADPYQATLLADTDAVRAMILEEARRSLFAEAGRYWSWKIQNTDMLWFPRAEGDTPETGYALLGGVRLHFPNDEYQLNPNFTNGLADRATGCPVAQRPIV